MSIVRDIDSIRYQAGTKLVELGETASLAYDEGKRAKDEVEQGLSIIELMKSLEFADYLTTEEVENILYCLVEIAEITAFPTAPELSVVEKPAILVGIQGERGPVGPQGPSGDSNVLVSSDPAYDNIKVTVVQVGEVKDYQLGYDPYVASLAALTIDNGSVREIGALNNVNFTASINDGRDPIVSQEITSPITPTWTTDPQSFVDSNLVINTRTTRVYTAQVNDGTTVDTDSKNVEFLFPFFWGSSPNILTGAEIYSQLAKKTEVAGNKNVLFNFTDEYAYFAFPEDYNDTNIQILDGSGFDVTDDFELVLHNQTAPTEPSQVTSGTSLAGGGGTDWTKNYKVYRTKVKTDISSATYQFLNITES